MCSDDANELTVLDLVHTIFISCRHCRLHTYPGPNGTPRSFCLHGSDTATPDHETTSHPCILRKTYVWRHSQIWRALLASELSQAITHLTLAHWTPCSALLARTHAHTRIDTHTHTHTHTPHTHTHTGLHRVAQTRPLLGDRFPRVSARHLASTSMTDTPLAGRKRKYDAYVKPTVTRSSPLEMRSTQVETRVAALTKRQRSQPCLCQCGLDCTTNYVIPFKPNTNGRLKMLKVCIQDPRACQ